MAVWIGTGVLDHGGKSYGYGEELPKDLPKETLAALIKGKKAADSVPATPQAVDINEKLTADLAAANEQIAELTAANEKLTADLAAANENVTKLTDQLMKPEAGPKKGK